MNNLGLPIIGLGETNEDYANLPLQWMPHIQVDDVAASVECALGLDANELFLWQGRRWQQSMGCDT